MEKDLTVKSQIEMKEHEQEKDPESSPEPETGRPIHTEIEGETRQSLDVNS